ncbi:hypothetical protein ACJIZ3_004706 [Penstemon smallii]|uniref:FHA domain-containing protein n=1 Tax=Penstemon smallii TaxID=265156 RepID=A0ABD3S306_9LAMI
MAAVPSVSIQWIHEDDLLLKNAVEAGASLEALAKGAVQFSRRFTFQELRDRWYSLLYDPDISSQAAGNMFKLEITGINPTSKLNRSENNIKGNKDIPRKRKVESIRRKYNSMRKKIRSDFFSNTDLGFFEPNPHEFSGNGSDFQKQVALDGNPLGQNCMLGGSVSDPLALDEEHLDFLRLAFPETLSDIAMASDRTNVPQTGCPNSFEDNCPNGAMGNYGFDENVSSSLMQGGNNMLESNVKNRNSPPALKYNSVNENPHSSSVGFENRQQLASPNSDGFASFQTIMFAPDQPHLGHWQDVSVSPGPVEMSLGNTAHCAEGMPHDTEGKENCSAVYTGEFADPDSLLNLSDEDEILLMDVDEDHTEDKSYITTTISPLLNSQKVGEEIGVPKIELETMTVSETSYVPAPNVNPVVPEVAAPPVHRDQQIHLYSEANVPVMSTSNSDFTEPSDGKICCTLNTEDTEIPCNDDIFLLIHPSTSFGSSSTQPSTTVTMDASTSALRKDNEQVVNLPIKAKDSTKSFEWPQKAGIQGLQESHLVQPLVGRANKTEMHESRPRALLPGPANKNIGDSSKGKSIYANPKVSRDRLVEEHVAGVATRIGDSSGTVTEITRSTEPSSGITGHAASVVDSSMSDEEESQIDDDVPYFSDIEATILEMDLDPYDQDSRVIKQAYQYDDTKRTIIRLEQGAHSCLQRAMTNQGALAILYGRHLRHYIRKPEVLLGRSTDDVDVDIDLRKEGRANKISRRQAIIKMEDDGSFFLKNLGKSSVSVNGMSVASGQLMNLSSSCLIEIRGMSFVFEINQRNVKKQLGNIYKKNKGKIGKSECSP